MGIAQAFEYKPYRDGYGRLHVDVVTESKPLPTNTPWLCTAVARTFGIDCPDISYFIMDLCISRLSSHPFEKTGVISCYELFGLTFFGLKYKNIEGWKYHGQRVPFYMRHAFLKVWKEHNLFYHLMYLIQRKRIKEPEFQMVEWLIGVDNTYDLFGCFPCAHPVKEMLGRKLITGFVE
jgi:hypothetical protein